MLGSLGRVGGVLSYCLTGFLFCAAILILIHLILRSSFLTIITLRLLYSFSSPWGDGPDQPLLKVWDHGMQMASQDTCVLPRSFLGLGTKAD